MMGAIDIIFQGSFGTRHIKFSALEKGHATAVGQAIHYLSEAEIPLAIALDHKCHAQGIEPVLGYAGIPIEGLTK